MCRLTLEFGGNLRRREEMTDEQKRLVHGALVDADHLAACCEKMLAAMNRRHAAVERGEVADEADIEACAAALVELEQAESDVSECWRAIRSATYEYRKRAERARAAFTPNDRVEGRDAALSRRVPSHDGLCGNGSEVGAGDTAIQEDWTK
jgi:hypothetical protein